MDEKKIVTPVQPYLRLDAKDYKEIFNKQMGIASFYEFQVKDQAQNSFKAVPDGSTDLIFGIGEKNVKVSIGGTVLKAKDWDFEDGRYYFGARFLPGRCILPKDLSIQDVVNNDVEIDLNDYGAGLTDRIAEAEDVEQRAQILMSYLAENQKGSCRDGAHTLEEYMRQRIYATKGNITIGMLSRETGYSECYIRRIFKQIHGISPKEFERFIRFQAFLNEITAAPGQADSEETALNCGYYDQSHMLKDFRAFAGTTPERYKKRICDGSDRRAAHTTINKQKENTHGIIKN